LSYVTLDMIWLRSIPAAALAGLVGACTSARDEPLRAFDAGDPWALLDASVVDAPASGHAPPAAAEGGPPRATAGPACVTPVAADLYAGARAACLFSMGATPAETLGVEVTGSAASAIKNIIVVMKENRSFDHLLGALHDDGRPEVEPIPADYSNLGPYGEVVAPFRQLDPCIRHDPGHQWYEVHAQIDHGKMDGFVRSAAGSTRTDGHFALSYYTPARLGFYYWLARTYAINDRHFASVASGTSPNRYFLFLGTADGVESTGGYPDASTATLFDALDHAGVTWHAYSDGALLGGAFDWTRSHLNVGDFPAFLRQLDDGTLPQVTFVDGVENVTDDHPPGNLAEGEAWTREIYEHAVASKLWPGLAIIWTYDEAGGFFDHVPPPTSACVARPGNRKDTGFRELGPRVPLVVISPYARPGYASHVVQEHTAITRFIASVFGLPALTSRDANSDALMDLFDFGCPPALLAPPPSPRPGSTACWSGGFGGG